MPSLGILPKKRQANFLLQLLELVEKQAQRGKRDAFRYANSPEVSKGPTIFVNHDEMILAFRFDDPQSQESINTSLRFTVIEDVWDPVAHQDETRGLGRKQLIELRSVGCDCDMLDGSFFHHIHCRHVVSAFEFLQKKLSRSSIEDALVWLDESIRQPSDVGRIFVDLLERTKVLENTDAVDASEYRLVWRVRESIEDGFPLSVEAYLQRRKGKSGWTAGRKLRDPIADLPDLTIGTEADRTMCMLYSTLCARHTLDCNSNSIIQGMEILQKCPHVVWDLDGYPPATIRRGVPMLTLKEEKDREGSITYIPDVSVDGMSIDLNTIVPIGKGLFGGWIIQDDAQTVVYFQFTNAQSQMVLMTMEAAEHGAQLDRDTAQRFSKLVSSASPVNKFSMVVPKSLAGPDVMLPPKIELQLEPREGMQLEARLRVTCHELDESPTPGLGQERVLVHTAAGIYHLVRDLDAEATSANEVANQLHLGDFAFDGPYTWKLANLDDSLKLIERVRMLGELAPTVCWPKTKPLRLIGDITPQSLRVRLTSERDWFGIDGELELDGLHVPLAELMVAIRGGGRYVKLGDNQFATISDELRARMATIDDLATADAKGLRLARAAAPLIDEAIGLDIPAERDARWQTAIEELNVLEQNPPQPPVELKADLRDYQVSGYQWLAKLSRWKLGGCLADDMGLGKTVQTLGVLIDRASEGPALIVAPTSVGVNWVRETERFAPTLSAHLYREHDRDHLIGTAGPGQLIITSYQMLQRDIERLASRKWATLVLDEAQYIKNFHTKTNQAVRRLEVDWSIALSGTPLENHLGELWSLLRVLCPGLLGSWERFRQRFGEPIEREKSKERLRALGHVVRPFILRRTKQEVLQELPPRTEIVLSAELSPAERKRYDAARVAALHELTQAEGVENDQQKRIRVLAWLTRLRQLACHPRLVDQRWDKSSAKLDLFMETVEELRASQHRALVFSQFVQHLSLVRQALDQQGIRYQYLDGSTTPARRQEAVDRFQAGDGDLFLISLKAGGTGLNLTAADFVLHLDPWWNPAVEDQATDRAHRIGQLRPVTVYRLVAKDTIEEQILAMHEDKRELLSGVLEGADRAARMSTQELVELIRDTQHLKV